MALDTLSNVKNDTRLEMAELAPLNRATFQFELHPNEDDDINRKTSKLGIGFITQN